MTNDHRRPDLGERIDGLEERQSLVLQAINNLNEQMNLRVVSGHNA